MSEKPETLASCRHGAVFDRHVFGVPREGYVNLPLPQHRHSKDCGYGKDMIAGRREFVDAGHDQILVDGIANRIGDRLRAAQARRVSPAC